MTINKVTVLGAGTMGAQLAALFVNAGLKVKLLDIVVDKNDPNLVAKKSYDKITDKKRPLLFDLNLASHLTYGNFDDDLVNDDADLYIEAVKEDIEIKHAVWQQVLQHAKEDALFATNTSGIPINAITQAFNEKDQERFFGLHFFNPPRIMKLVELIPTSHTKESIILDVKNFAQNVLDKGVIVVNDVPGFVANRVGTQTMNDIMYRAEQHKLSIVDVDALTGQAIGRPKTGTYALSDLVGLDIAVSVIKGMQQVPEEAPYFNDVKIVNTLFENGALGRKTKQGFYKKDKETKARLVYDVEKQDYVPVSRPQLPILNEFNKDLVHNLDTIFNAQDEAGLFLWETLRNNFYYSAINVPKATDEFNDALVDAIDLLENDHYTSMVIYADGNNFSVGANLFLMKKAHEDGLVDDVVAQSIDKLHYSFNRLKYSLKPVVTAVQGRALGGGCELVLYSPIVVAASETYIGLVEAGVGLLPSGGGLAEMADRILRTSHKFDDKQASMTKVLTNIAFAKVSTNAFEARRYGYLRDTDTIIFNTAQRVEVALKRAKYEAETNYIPNPRHQYIALGEDFKALIQGQLDAQRRGHFISDHDYHIALNIATILAGGDLPRNTFINQRYIQSLEKIGFIDLLKSKKSYERIAHMLKTGKPLRN
ncbi:TPA: 3-hydroxyacyl-CoA dehydrogenase/enoyl-CoA hydratase family protein [Staphylococcus aureus]|nr:3-hydroxyacyl-CoA dehydrogenase/enoyl-CoA hydratase family protein [Staphylococcus aureus]